LLTDVNKIWNEYKDPNETALTPTLSWEYWNKKGWVGLKGLIDETANLLEDGKITFDLPEDIEKTEIAGQESYWIRARIIGGDYGKETYTASFDPKKFASGNFEQQLISSKNSIRPPIINSLKISYSLEKSHFPQQCLTYNNLEYLDQLDACKLEGKHFSPFDQLEDKNKILYLGFEKALVGGPIRIFFEAKELPFTEDKKPKMVWSYSAKDEWKELSYLDATEALILREILELIGPVEFFAQTKFGYEKKDTEGKVVETWILWDEVSNFFDSTEKNRYYMLDHATGQLQFGDGNKGMIPPTGENNIKAFSYRSGGGAQGNVKAGEIKTIKTAVPGVDNVTNPIAADGGADTATLDQMLEIGPSKISHRNRAVTVEDFEWLARLASRKIVKVRCLPNLNNRMQAERGWVTVIIVPESQEAKPYPSLELRRKVRQYLEANCANTLTQAEHIYVTGPSYHAISVSVDVFINSINVATEVDREAKTKLNAFFHPLTGGPEKNGWDFGRDVSVSDIYVLLEDIDGIDHVENLRFTYEGITNNDRDIVEINKNYLVANGIHTINIQLTNKE
jgi:uncharacterized phage protein gp47/JayE